MIKPEEIPDELVEELLRPRKSDDWKQQIADDLNAAIEAGVVSPACYCLRWNGELQTHSTACPKTGLLHPKLFAGKPWADDQEHYRGQTE